MTNENVRSTSKVRVLTNASNTRRYALSKCTSGRDDSNQQREKVLVLRAKHQLSTVANDWFLEAWKAGAVTHASVLAHGSEDAGKLSEQQSKSGSVDRLLGPLAFVRQVSHKIPAPSSSSSESPNRQT